MNITTINELKLDRDKVLDEAIFLAICGRNQIKETSKIAGIVILEMSCNSLNRMIEHLNEEISNQDEYPQDVLIGITKGL